MCLKSDQTKKDDLSRKYCLKTRRSAGFKEACRDMSWLQSGSQMALKTLQITPFLYLHLLLTGAASSFCDHVAKTLKDLTPKTGSKLSEMLHRMSPSHPGYSRGILVPLFFRAFIILTRILILNSSSSPFYFPRFSFWGWYTTSFPNPLPHDRWLHSFSTEPWIVPVGMHACWG